MMRFSGSLFSFPRALSDRFDQLNGLYGDNREGEKAVCCRLFPGRFTPELYDNFVM